MICTPIGRPLSLRPFGIVVAGSPFSVAMPAQAILVVIGDFAAIDVELTAALRTMVVRKGQARHRWTQDDIDLPE